MCVQKEIKTKLNQGNMQDRAENKMEDQLQALLHFFETHKSQFSCMDAYRFVSALHNIRQIHALADERLNFVKDATSRLELRAEEILGHVRNLDSGETGAKPELSTPAPYHETDYGDLKQSW